VAAKTIPAPPPHRGNVLLSRVNQACIEAIPSIAAELRDTAVRRNFSIEETKDLADKAAMQEYRLLETAEIARTIYDDEVNIDAIREPFMNIPVGSYGQGPVFQSKDLLKLRMVGSMNELTQEQRDAIAGLGMSEENSASILIDQPSTRSQIDALANVLKATEFSAELPYWGPID
jgi:hypothetical protein